MNKVGLDLSVLSIEVNRAFYNIFFKCNKSDITLQINLKFLKIIFSARKNDWRRKRIESWRRQRIGGSEVWIPLPWVNSSFSPLESIKKELESEKL